MGYDPKVVVEYENEAGEKSVGVSPFSRTLFGGTRSGGISALYDFGPQHVFMRNRLSAGKRCIEGFLHLWKDHALGQKRDQI